MGATESTAQPSDNMQADFETLDFYSILDVTEDATSEQIRAAYRKKALEHHPDKNMDNVEQANKRFTKVKEAYDVLSSEVTRNMYNIDRSAFHPKPSSTGPYSDASTGNESPDTPVTPGGWQHSEARGGTAQSWYEWFFGQATEPPGRNDNYDGGNNERPRRAYDDASHSRPHDGNGHPDAGMSTRDILFTLSALGPMCWCLSNCHNQSAYSVFNQFFLQLAREEIVWSKLPMSSYPIFGSIDSVWTRAPWNEGDAAEVRDFYTFWRNFKTAKTFEWVKRYDDGGIQLNPRGMRWIRKENKLLQDALRNQYNEVIRTLAATLLNSDQRYLMHRAFEEEWRRQNHNGGHDVDEQKRKQKQKKKDKKKRKKQNW